MQPEIEFETSAYRLHFEFHNKDMECRATFISKEEGAVISADQVISILKDNDICGINPEQIEKLCRKACEGRSQKNMVIAQGVPPEPGADGWLEHFFFPPSAETRFSKDKKNRIDYRSRHSFQNVKADDVLGKIHPPQAGQPGRTVRNTPIPPVAGKEFKFRPGKGVRLSEDGLLIVAKHGGHLVVKGDSLSVSEKLEINGNVDLNIGHIDFAGVVTIKGDVLDGFNVRASKGVHISGTVSASRIVSGGDVTIGSMYGKDIGKIECLGTLQAHHLCNVHVECHGNVIVTKEIRESVVKALGVISVENGNIFGGKCIVLHGLEAKNIGSPVGVETFIAVGFFFLDSDRETELQKRMDVVSFQEEHIGYILGDISAENLDSLSDGVKTRYYFLNETLEKIKKEKSILLKEQETYNRLDSAAPANPRINVKGTLFDGVSIELGNQKAKIDSEKDGPFSIVESLKDQCLLFLSWSPLKLHDRGTGKTLTKRKGLPPDCRSVLSYRLCSWLPDMLGRQYGDNK